MVHIKKIEKKENKSLVSIITSAAQYCTLASREKGSRGVTKIWKEKTKSSLITDDLYFTQKHEHQEF